MDALITGALPGIERLPALRAVTERLAQHMAASLSVLTGEEVDVTVRSPRAVRFREVLAELPMPAMLAVLRLDPWDGGCVAALDAGLAGVAIDLLLGGRRGGARADVATRGCTAIEQAVVQRLAADVLGGDLARAFGPLAAVEGVFERMESAPNAVAIAKPNAAAVTFRADVVIGDHAGGVDFVIPLATLDPVKDLLAREMIDRRPGGDAAWQAHLRAELPQASVRLRAVVERRRISSAEVLRWRVGAVLPLSCRHDDAISLLCRELPLLRARIAEKDGHIALHVEERCFADDWPAG